MIGDTCRKTEINRNKRSTSLLNKYLSRITELDITTIQKKDSNPKESKTQNTNKRKSTRRNRYDT